MNVRHKAGPFLADEKARIIFAHTIYASAQPKHAPLSLLLKWILGIKNADHENRYPF